MRMAAWVMIGGFLILFAAWMWAGICSVEDRHEIRQTASDR